MMQKKCSACGSPFQLSGSGKRQKYCPECSKQGVAHKQGLPASNPLISKRAKSGLRKDLGAFVRAQIVEAVKQGQSNPISFTTPDGVRGRVWLGHNENGKSLIGDDRHWRLNVPAASRVDQDARNKRITASLTDIWQTELGFPPMGFRVRVGIETEKELQPLGCGWRIVTCQFRGDKVLLHHNGNTAKMKRTAFRAFIAANKKLRRKPARLRLVVSNPQTGERRAA